MTTVNAETYFQVGAGLIEISTVIEGFLRHVQQHLDVARSAGLYPYGGPQWAKSFDQSAVDLFEAGSLAAMAANALGLQIHTAGQNLVHAENGSHSGAPDPIPTPPTGTTLTISLRPTQLSVGGTGGDPDHWDLVAPQVTRKWADCDEARITEAGVLLKTMGAISEDHANQVYRSVRELFPDEARSQDPILAEYVSDTAALCRAMQAYSDAATYLGIACESVATTAESAKKDCRTSLNLLWVLLASYEADKAAAERLPAGDGAQAAIDALIATNKTEYAAAISARLGDIEATVTATVASNEGIYDMVTTQTADLQSILGRTPRSTRYIGGRDITQNKKAGEDGEARAGIDPSVTKRRISIIDRDGNALFSDPDRIDTTNRQLTEVKNTNDIVDNKRQLLIQEQWARDNGYTYTLIVDHRTQINDPDIAGMIETGQIQLIRMELDDGSPI
ncbi:putative toxin [Nocardia takedensis]|uniref:putative toxin n=1 Tax=Nocardia takedensis TaxID=259390 RepID=UPI0005942F19|nr:putative toxin [Nocardia takedensis]